jgi:DNA polymerase-3 subunit alpha
MPHPFIHLHVHSHYSLLNALPKIDDLVAKAKELNMPAMAITDAGNMYGVIDFYMACVKKGIKPIIGVDFYVATRTRKDMQAGVDSRRHRLVLLAKDFDGYKNLIKLVTHSNLEGFYYKPRIDKELIEKHNNGLIAIAPSFSSEISAALKMRDIEKAKEKIAWYKSVYPDFYIEITRHPEIDGHEGLMNQLIKLAHETDTPLVAAHDVYYINEEDRAARDTLMLVNSHSDGSDKTENDDENFSFISQEKANELFSDIPEALDNTQKIADMCNVTLTLGKWLFPKYVVESGLSYDEELRRIAYEGIPKRGLELTKEVTTRLDYELEVIKNKGYAQYFLVVSDLLKYAHENGILTNIRGSVAGSLTTYVTRITNVDPLAYNLPFERFLNPERPSAPDIDMDFADNRRDEVIDYVRNKYGHDKVAQIGTFGTMMAKGAVRDVARAMGYPYEVADRISKLIPMGAQGFPMTIERALEEVTEFRDLYNKDTDTKRIVDMAQKIEGCARHISVHAAGVVIGPEALIEYVPLQYDTKGDNKIITQYDMHAVGEDGVGLLKFDFLGIKNLAILADAIDRVKKIEDIKIDIDEIPLDDIKTFEILAKGQTTGLFQLNGTGMTKFLVDLKPSRIHDINAMVALYRPGPLESIPEYIERKHDPEKVKYLDPRMKDILDMSYGVITYQDDVMMIAIKLGGYSWLEADKLRKAMGKKIPKEMEEQKGKLLAGLEKNGMSEKKAMQLWKLIEPFAAYGFNKAHAASYGRVAYQTAYMKANYPAIYMSAVLTADSGDVEKIGEFIAECRRMAIPILPPDINESFSQFTVVPGEQQTIRFGLVTIKNFGQGIATAIIDERKRGGHFTSLVNFLDRVRDRNLNKKSLEALIKVGAIDSFGIDRGVLMGNIENLLAYNKEHEKLPTNQDSLFGFMADTSTLPTLKLAEVDKVSEKDRLAWEKELLGLYISGHPLDPYREKISSRDMDIARAKLIDDTQKEVIIPCIIEMVKPLNTKKGDMMAFLTLSDFSGSIEAVAFPKLYESSKALLQVDKCLAVKGKVNERNGVKSFIIEKVKEL